MRILITGGAGFIGSNLVAQLAARGGHDLHVLDNESLGSRATLTGYPHRFILGDILDRPCLDAALSGMDAVVHLAADTRVMDSIADPAHNFRNNVECTFQLLDLARRHKIRRIVVASTGGAILGNAAPPIHEEMVARPLAPYGASKLAAEGYCSAFGAAYGMSIVCLRFSNIYGPGSLHKGSVVAHFMKRLLHGEDLVIYGDGSQVRDFLFVDDLILGVIEAMQRDISGVLQLGSGIPTAVNDLLDEMRVVLGPAFRSAVRRAPLRAGEVQKTWCDISRARAALGFSPATTLAQGLRQTWRWFQEMSAHPGSACS